MRSQIPMTSFIWCSMSRIVSWNSRRIHRMNSISWSISDGFMPAAGSSSSSSSGRVASAGHFQPPLVAVREAARGFPARCSSLKMASRSREWPTMRSFLRRKRPLWSSASMRRITRLGKVRDPHVVEHRQVTEQADVLNVRGNTPGSDLVGRAAHELFVAIADAAFARPVNAGDQVEHRRLARAVWPDQAHQFTWCRSRLKSSIARRPPKLCLMLRGRQQRHDCSCPDA
jgi:hypothetical protein